MSTAIAAGGVSLRNLTYHYPGSTTAALAAVGLELPPGLTAVAGRSGSGKSTLLRLLNGLVPHFHGGTISGAVRVEGVDALRTPTATLARQVGFVFQDPEAQFVRGRVEDEVAFSLENTGVPPSRIAARVEAAMFAAGVASLAGRAIDSLSGGERQRVAIASALALRPRILVLDEPTAQLDPAGSAAVMAACTALARSGTSVLLSEHRVAALLPNADQLLVIESGHLMGPGAVTPMLRHLVDPPSLVALGRALRWEPPPLTVAAARALAPGLPRTLPPWRPASGEPAWQLRDCELTRGPRSVLMAPDVGGAAGEVTVLMGPNGGGKTTLLRAIAGLHQPAAGSAWRRPARVAYLPQDPGVLLHRESVLAEVEYTLRRARSRQSPLTLLRRLGLAELSHRYPGDLSSGQRQRAALAAILAGDPGLVLLDEPTRGMDGDARRALAGLLREMAGGGASVVLATHDADLAAELADRVVVVDRSIASPAVNPAGVLGAGGRYPTDIGRLYPGGPLTVDAVLACL